MTQLFAVYDGSNALIQGFEYAAGRAPPSMVSGGVRYYLFYDQIGSLLGFFDQTGSIVKGLTYDSFGNILADTNPSFSNQFGFAGGLHDRDTNLVRFGYRDYDPEIGRWTAKDPVLFAGNDTGLYMYVKKNPVNLADFYGLYWVKTAAGGWNQFEGPLNVGIVLGIFS